MEKILLQSEGGIRWLVFNDPEKRNALSLEMRTAAIAALEEVARDDTARVLVLTGAGDRAFVSGGNISQFDALAAPDGASRFSHSVFDVVRDFEKPTMAMIRGYCFGAGLALAALCDLRFCAEDASFSIPAARLGLGYPPNLTQPLMDLLGPSVTKEMLYSARRYDAREALSLGLVNHVYPGETLQDEVRNFARLVEANAPLSVRATKVVVNECMKPPAERDQGRIDKVLQACLSSEDFRNGQRAFMEKKKPIFSGR